MRDKSHRKQSLQRFLERLAANPSIIWLTFIAPFLLPLSQIVPIVGALVTVLMGALVWWATKNRIYSWRTTLFIPLLLLLVSSYITYYYFNDWHIIWSLFAIALSAGWLWRVEYILTHIQPFEIDEWLFSARLFGIGSLAYIIVYWIAMQQGLDRLLFQNLLPPTLMILGIITHRIRVTKQQKCQSHSFSCPVGAPLVRMAIVRNNEVWLTSTPYTGCFVETGENRAILCNPRRYKDHPITSCVSQDEAPEISLERAYRNADLKLKECPRFLLKYKYKSSPSVERTIYLYVLNLQPNTRSSTLSLRGQFYTPDQVDQMISEGRFGKLFMEEYNYLKQTLFLSNTLIKQQTSER